MMVVFITSIGFTVLAQTNTEEQEKIMFAQQEGKMVPKQGNESTLITNKCTEKFDNEVQQFEAEVGKIVDKYSNSKGVSYQKKSSSLNLNDRIDVLKAITNIYTKVNKEEAQRLDVYLEAATTVFSDTYTVKKNNRITAENLISRTSASLSKTDMINYAYDYVSTFGNNSDYNIPTYPDVEGLGGDCANFVSQILHAGGYQMDSEWYIYRKNTTYPRPTTTTQLDYSWDLHDQSPWISAKEFNNYWKDKVSTDTYDENDFVNTSHFSEPYYTGDTVQLLKKSGFFYYGYHTMFITEYVTNSLGDSDFGVTYHTSNRKDLPLVDVVKAFINMGGAYKVKFFDTYN